MAHELMVISQDDFDRFHHRSPNFPPRTQMALSPGDSKFDTEASMAPVAEERMM